MQTHNKDLASGDYLNIRKTINLFLSSIQQMIEKEEDLKRYPTDESLREINDYIFEKLHGTFIVGNVA